MFTAVAGVVVAGAIIAPLPVFPFDVIDTSILILEQGTTRDEDVFVAAGSGRVDGTIEGDLVIATGDLSIDGLVTGDLLVASHGKVRITGSIEGSVRGVVQSVDVDGSIGDDLAVVAVSTNVLGSVGRDLLAVGRVVRVRGEVGRDVRGRMWRLLVDGDVGRDVDVSVRTLDVRGGAAVGGDLVYRADRGAEVPAGATVGGVTTRLSSRGSFLVRGYLAVANALGFVLFLLAGLLAIWVFRASASRAAGVVVIRPVRTLLVGLVAGVAAPVVVVLLFVAVGSVLATMAAAALVGTLVVAVLAFGPVPALTAFGDRVTRGRAGLFGGFLIGSVIWRLVAWWVPLLGAVIGVAAYVWGVGGWLAAGWDDRRHAIEAAPLMPDVRRRDGPADERPPLPPL